MDSNNNKMCRCGHELYKLQVLKVLPKLGNLFDLKCRLNHSSQNHIDFNGYDILLQKTILRLLSPKIQNGDCKCKSVSETKPEINLPCLNKDRGCGFEGGINEISNHLISQCKFQPIYPCVVTDCPIRNLSSAQLIQHLVKLHNSQVFPVDSDSDVSIPIEWILPDITGPAKKSQQWVPAVLILPTGPLLLTVEVRHPYLNVWLWNLENSKHRNDLQIKCSLDSVRVTAENQYGVKEELRDEWIQEILPFDKNNEAKTLDFKKGGSYQVKIMSLFMRNVFYTPEGEYFVIRVQTN